MSYDTHCGDLARFFLADVGRSNDAAQVQSLAQAIQDAVGAWFEEATLPKELPGAAEP